MMRGYGGGYGTMMSGGGTWLFLGFLFLLFAILVIAAVVFLIVWAVQSSKTRGHGMEHAHGQAPGPYPPIAAQPGGAGHDEAIAIAKKRLASGEISSDEYNEIMKTLHS